MSAIRIIVAEVRGSAPREAGAAMLVFEDHIEGTIGGGALEWQAMRIARAMLADGSGQARHAFPLGPALGQCCGGVVTLKFEAADTLPRAIGAPLWIWGAGHVGRALVHIISPTQVFEITWIDTGLDRFPTEIPTGFTKLVATDPPRLMPRAPKETQHLFVTFSHDIDLALCHAALCHGFAGVGLIGSATKWARFCARLRQLGHSDAEISRITCPIGDPSLGKHPQSIAIGVAARLLGRQMPKESARAHVCEGT